ncbi:aminotransferase class IV family protein [Kitasatospora paracochleata]|uniref:Branched-subunit amino acid aminotransferase/4-amino-4-deoxychorismate lyase n=1 Tax=Kitasatospora paracochleata TaxID=58354 RepID=A0ABT1J4Y8_9ACTN|nr:aminotransferase class IV [Kitasatospora paracochleata]MCP2312502.1 branched-subunit amino acid aminotransferase/4-amino-4-deoxychorismate lyase [Kitasatospora paracochleata]
MTELDGRPVDPADLQALALTNYGHFTTMRVEDGRVRGLALHLERLDRDCRTLFGVAPDLERIRAYARRALPDSGALVVRVTLFDPALDVGSIGAAAEPRVLVTTRPAGPPALGPIRVRTAGYVRDLPQVKGVGLYGALRLRREARLAGWDDVLFTDPRGRLTEGGTWNLGLVRGGEVVWPRGAYLPGTTLRLLQDLEPTGVTEEVAGPEGFEAAFATNAAVGVRALAAIDSTALAVDHPVVARLREAYTALPGEPL